MGGRGASSGMSDKGKAYGTQFHPIIGYDGRPLVRGNIKFVESNGRTSESLFETKTRGRVYAVVGGKDLLKIVYFDNKNRHTKEINFGHKHAGMDPHVHHGYNHNENDSSKGAANLTPKEKKLVERVEKTWYDHLGRR